MFTKDIEIIKDNIDKKIVVSISSTNKIDCRVIGYGIIKSPVSGKDKLKVLLWREETTSYKFPYKTLTDYVVLTSITDINPDDFLSVPFNCIKFDRDNKMISCY